MSEQFEQDVPVSAYGAQRKAAWLARLQANSDMAKNAELAAYGRSEDRRVTQAGQQGLFPHMTPYDRGAAVADMQPIVGSDYGGRPLEKLGGMLPHSDVGCSPAPARVDMRFIRQPGGAPAADAESGLARFMRERQQ
jgi:hypothetical protein